MTQKARHIMNEGNLENQLREREAKLAEAMARAEKAEAELAELRKRWDEERNHGASTIE
jgi:hypothetical protein